MQPCDIYDCRVGYIVLTGDSYGMDVCCCVAESSQSNNEDCDYPVVKFLNMTNGKIQESGASD